MKLGLYSNHRVHADATRVGPPSARLNSRPLVSLATFEVREDTYE